MFHKFIKALNNLHRGQKGITGLETAIILIAFVTVASVLAYSVLSAGIFSSERGKAAVYSGLQSAQSTMDLKGSMVGVAADVTDVLADDPLYDGTPVKLGTVTFYLGLAISGEPVNLDQVVFKYWDVNTDVTGTPTVTYTIVHDGADVAGTILSGTDMARIVVDVTAYNVADYETFTIQVLPPTGANITIERTLGALSDFMSLH